MDIKDQLDAAIRNVESNQVGLREQVFGLSTSHDKFRHLIYVSENMMANLQGRRRIKNLLLFIPNLILLCVRLMRDRRVSGTDRALVAGAVIYALIPLDLIPDMIPFVGQIDDLYLIALTLVRLLDRADPRLVREYWNGGGDVVQLIASTVTVTGKLLPKRIRRVLTARVEVAHDRGTGAKGVMHPVLVARPEIESEK